MPKLTIEQAKELLAAAGVAAVEIVDNEDASDYNTTATAAAPITKDSLLVAIDNSREAIIAPKVIAREKALIEPTITGKFHGTLRSQLSQKTGIPLAELKDLEIPDAIKKAYDFYANTLGADKSVLIAERDSLMAKHADAIKAKDTEWETKLNGVTSKLTEKEIIAKLVKDHNEAKGLPPTANKTELAKMFKTYLDGSYVVKYNEAKDEVELYDKANPDTRVYTNDTKTAYATPKDLLKPHYSGLGIWNEDNRTINPNEEMNKQKLNEYKGNQKPGADGRPVSRVDEGNKAWGDYAASKVGT